MKNLTANYTLLAADNGTILVCDGTFNLEIPSPTDFSEMEVDIKSSTGTTTLTQYISKVLTAGLACKLIKDGTKWVVIDTDEETGSLPLSVAKGGTGRSTTLITAQNDFLVGNAAGTDVEKKTLAETKAILLDTIILPEKTPVNSVAASKLLTIGTNPIEAATVTVGTKVYKFRAVLGAGVAATGTLTFNSELPHDGDTVILGSTTYTFKTALTPTAGEVLIEAAVTDTIDNLVAAVTGGAGAGTKYATGTVSQGAATASKSSADTMLMTYNSVGFLGNQYDTLGTLTHATWGNTTLTGGIDAQAANNVLIGLNTEASIDNLVLAITAGAGIGVNYGTGTTVNTLATAAKASAATMTATNLIKGVIGNSTAIAETLADGSWAAGATALSGGIDGTTGLANETCADASYIYHAIAANTIADANWRRITLGTAF